MIVILIYMIGFVITTYTIFKLYKNRYLINPNDPNMTNKDTLTLSILGGLIFPLILIDFVLEKITSLINKYLIPYKFKKWLNKHIYNN